MTEEQQAIAKSLPDVPSAVPEADAFTQAHAQFVQQIYGVPAEATPLKGGKSDEADPNGGYFDFSNGNFVRTGYAQEDKGGTAGLSSRGIFPDRLEGTQTESKPPASGSHLPGGSDSSPPVAKPVETPLANSTDLSPEAQLTYDQFVKQQLQLDPRWGNLLNSPSIDRSHSDKTDGKGHELWERSTDDVHSIVVRKGHQSGDPPANYVIDKNGKVHELIPPDKKAMGQGDDAVTIELDNSAAAAAEQANAAQVAAANAIIAQIQADCANAGVAPEIPADVAAMLSPKPVPPPQAVVRGGGHGASMGGGGSLGGGNGGSPRGFQAPGVGPRNAAPSRAQASDVPGATKAGHADFSKLNMKDIPPSVQKVVKLISKNEGSPTSINWNDNGYGISVGMYQANQKAGELPGLLKKMHEDNPQKFNQVFGPYAEKMLNEGYVRSVPISKGSDLGNRMQTALNQPEFQETQLKMIANKVVQCADILKGHGITSEAGVALYTDMVNQLGFGGASKYLNRVQGSSEEARVASLDHAARSGSGWRAGRNPHVQAQIAQLGLDRSSGTFNA